MLSASTKNAFRLPYFSYKEKQKKYIVASDKLPFPLCYIFNVVFACVSLLEIGIWHSCQKKEHTALKV